MKKFVLLYIAVVMLVVSGCSDSSIGKVQNGVIGFDDSVTVGDALNNYQYFSEKDWRSYEDDQNRTIVEFNGEMDYDKFIGSKYMNMELTADQVASNKEKIGDMRVRYVAQFVLSKSGDTFRTGYSGLTIDGAHKDTGEKFEENIPDKNLSTVKNIYLNNPEIATWGLLYAKENYGKSFFLS